MSDAYKRNEHSLKVSLLPLNNVHLPLCMLLTIVIRLSLFFLIISYHTCIVPLQILESNVCKKFSFLATVLTKSTHKALSEWKTLQKLKGLPQIEKVLPKSESSFIKLYLPFENTTTLFFILHIFANTSYNLKHHHICTKLCQFFCHHSVEQGNISLFSNPTH